MTQALPPTDAPVLAVDVGGTTIKAEVVDGHGDVLASGVEPTPIGDVALEAVARLGSRLIEKVETAGAVRVSRAGVALPGIVDRDQLLGVLSVNVGWRRLAFGPLQEVWARPVLIDHDVTIAGWAEWQAGAGRGCDDIVFVAVGTGIAASIVVGGHLVRGGLSQAGELGHVVVRPDGAQCGCGARGCLEAVASAAAIARAYAARAGRQVNSAVDVLLAMTDDPAAARVWDDAVAALADGLVGVVNLLSPERIVVGGGLAAAGDVLIDPLRRALTTRANVVPAPDLVLAQFGARAALVGAAMLARRGGADIS